MRARRRGDADRSVTHGERTDARATGADDARWQAPLAALATLRATPLELPALETWLEAIDFDREEVVFDVTFLARQPGRSALVLHRGDPSSLAGVAEPLTLLGLVGGRAVVDHVGADGARRRWASGRVRAGWHRATVVLRRDDGGRLAPCSAALDGRSLVPTAADRWRDVHGSLPNAAAVTLGGLRDRAGGHTDLRFGERRGELVTRFVATRRPVGGASERPFAVGGEAHTTVLWDHGDRVELASVPGASAALVRERVEGYRIDPDGRGRRVRAPRRRPGVRGVPVFAPGDGGYAAFRIPAVVRAADGALLAFAEGRVESVSDACRTKDIVLRRSEDGGRSWSPLRVVARAPKGPAGRSLMNPSPVVDARSGGRLVVLAAWLEADEWALAAGHGRGRLMAWRSADHGRSWSSGVDVAAQLDLPTDLALAWPHADGWRLQVGTLGHGIQLRHGPHPGRLCFVGHGTFGPASVFDSVGFLFWSDDGGDRWTIGPALVRRADGSVARGWNESTLAERPDGSLLLNARQYRDGRPVGRRARALVAWDGRGHAIVGPVEDDDALVDSGVQGSLVALPDGRVAFCNPAHPRARAWLTLRIGTIGSDGSATWSVATRLVDGRVGYSDLVPLASDRIGVLYEHGLDGSIAFVVAPVDPP